MDGISDKVRRIAILVTSLDAAAGRQLLLAMPTEFARQVRRAMTQLGKIDADEQRQILAEFRSQAVADPVKSHNASAVAGTAKFPTASSITDTTTHQTESNVAGTARFQYEPQPTNDQYNVHENPAPLNSHLPTSNDSRPWQRLDVDALFDLLRGERAPVIAVVLSQLEASRAARLLERLTRAQQRDAIATLSRLGSIDPEAMAAIDEHLAGRIADYHHRRASESESVGRMQELLAAASPDARGQWQTIIQETDVQLAQRMGLEAPSVAAIARSTPPAQPKSTPAYSAAQPASSAASSHNILELLSNNIVTTVDTQSATVSTNRKGTAIQPPTKAPRTILSSAAVEGDESPTILPFPGSRDGQSTRKSMTEAQMRFDDILELPAEQIGQVLAAASTEVILLALAGASPAFMKRFTAMLEKRDARALEARLKEMRSINLKDVDEAQRRLCQLATEQMASGQAASGPLSPQAAAA